MKGIDTIINRARYAWLRHAVGRMAYDDQRKVALAAYKEIDGAYAGHVGEQNGVCTVNFQCPYDGHVSYHCLRVLKARKADAADVLSDYVMEKTGEDSWRLTVIVGTSDEDAARAADAVAMTTVLGIPTVAGDFVRSYALVPATVRNAQVAVLPTN